jgi:hypothetical protein
VWSSPTLYPPLNPLLRRGNMVDLGGKMKGFWKSLFTIGAVAGVGYLGFKGYRRVSDVMKMSKTLPDYLNDLLEERPKVDINMRLTSLSVAIGLTAETYEKVNVELDEQIDRYINDYYPNLAKLRLSVTKYIKSADEEIEEEEDEECDLGCSCEVKVGSE